MVLALRFLPPKTRLQVKEAPARHDSGPDKTFDLPKAGKAAKSAPLMMQKSRPLAKSSHSIPYSSLL
jgi:hypothetical protein